MTETIAQIARGPDCIECGAAANLTDGKVIYPHRPDLYAKRFWRCDCGAYCGCHGMTTEPLGNPCGPATRKARSAAHAAFDPLWKSRRLKRSEAYKWLAKAMKMHPAQCHIGMMTADQARQVVARVRTYLEQNP